MENTDIIKKVIETSYDAGYYAATLEKCKDVLVDDYKREQYINLSNETIRARNELTEKMNTLLNSTTGLFNAVYQDNQCYTLYKPDKNITLNEYISVLPKRTAIAMVSLYDALHSF